ncbi:hypothetical protein KBB48_03415 [Candidatus Shapirobacteria bacterium]|nr:hypothetical protein [Candidatus Shapirobacteria bacterium]
MKKNKVECLVVECVVNSRKRCDIGARLGYAACFQDQSNEGPIVCNPSPTLKAHEEAAETYNTITNAPNNPSDGSTRSR